MSLDEVVILSLTLGLSGALGVIAVAMGWLIVKRPHDVYPNQLAFVGAAIEVACKWLVGIYSKTARLAKARK